MACRGCHSSGQFQTSAGRIASPELWKRNKKFNLEGHAHFPTCSCYTRMLFWQHGGGHDLNTWNRRKAAEKATRQPLDVDDSNEEISGPPNVPALV